MDASRRFPHLAEVVAASLTGEAGCPPRQASDTNRFGGDASQGLCRCCGAPVVRGPPVVRTAARTQPSHPSWTPARVIVKTSGVQTGRLRGRVNRRLKAVRRLSDDLSGPSTRATWATRPSRGPGTLWAPRAQQSQSAAPTPCCERLPSPSWACNCLPLSVRLDVVERPDAQPLASGQFQHPVEFTLGFVRTTGFELRCEDNVAAVIAEFPHGTGQTIGFATPVEIPHAPLVCEMHVVWLQRGISARRNAKPGDRRQPPWEAREPSWSSGNWSPAWPSRALVRCAHWGDVARR